MKTIPKIHSDIQIFIKVITGDAIEAMTFQTFSDKKKNDRSVAKVIHGKAHDVYQQLLRLNEHDVGIFAMINEGDLKGRKADNVVKIRAVFADFDETPYDAEAMPLQPHLVVETSSSKHHVYWLVSEFPLDSFTTVQKAIAARFRSDPKVVDLSRVMRVPGFYHQKGDPFLTHIVERNDIPTYTLEEIVGELGLDLSAVKATSKKGRTHRNVFGGPDNYCLIDPVTGEIILELSKWVKRYPDFMIADALQTYAPDIVQGLIRDSKQHIRCPFHDEHTDQSDDLATFCINGADKNKNNEGFVIHCCHAHCDSRDRLDYIRKMLELGWLSVEALTDRHFLAERRRPKWVRNHLDHWERSQGYNSLTPVEQGHFLRFERICLCTGEGQCKGDDWLLHRQLGVSIEEWRELRETFLRSGLLKAENGHLVNDHIFDTYEQSRQDYEKRARSGREGGKSRSQK